jgi:hypothetical protein
MTDIRSLEDAAVALQQARAELEEAQRRRDELEPAWDAAGERLHRAYDAVERIEHGMESVIKAHAVAVALTEAGVEYDGPPMIVRPSRSRYEKPVPYVLVAVGPKGTGLYLFKPEKSHRYQGKEHTIREADALAHGLTEPYGGANGGWSYEPTHEWLREDGLWAWQKRGRGNFGDGSGAFKPLPPPEGGRWKWLKIREQEAITSG